MPEGLEAEMYRRGAEQVIGRVVASVDIDPRQPQAVEIGTALPGRKVIGVGRIGKQVWLDFDPPAGSVPLRLGLHFGMAGRLAVDGVPAIDALAYSSERWDAAWTRLELVFTVDSGGGSLIVNDPRRWSRFTLDPDVTQLGTDLFDVDADELNRRLRGRRAPIKSVLLDQSVIAGLGNLLVDEMLWQTGIDPRRPANELDSSETDRLVENLRDRLPTMLAAGGSHTGTLDPDRRRELGTCPHPDCGDQVDQTESDLVRDHVGGRATVRCQRHQR